jgi:predicted nucleic acid-binding protein
MVKALFDTNIFIDYLSGIAAAKKELERFPDKAISLNYLDGSHGWCESANRISPERIS